MRPGQLTPENVTTRIGHHAGNNASMRPGQLTPENAFQIGDVRLGYGGFNEAGAINPGKRGAVRPDREPRRASMRPGQLTPENFVSDRSSPQYQ